MRCHLLLGSSTTGPASLPRSQRPPGHRCHHGPMDIGEILDAIGGRLAPGPVPDDGPWILLALAVAALAVVVPPLWRLLRPGATIVHQRGHAAVGVLMGRRFPGFLAPAPMPGLPVPGGPRRGTARVLP